MFLKLEFSFFKIQLYEHFNLSKFNFLKFIFPKFNLLDSILKIEFFPNSTSKNQPIYVNIQCNKIQ